MKPSEIESMQIRLKSAGYYHGEIDGYWGRLSIAACKAYVRSFMPKVSPWPKSDQASLRAFYGAAGDEANLVTITFPFPMYYGEKLVKTTRVHRKCAASLLRILTSIGLKFNQKRDILEEAEDYGGVFNFRPKRGGSTWSCHAWGAAIDLDADDNTFKDSWPMQADMNLDVILEFAKEGWISAAVEWGYDAMHMQATQ